jgi:nitroimidazol reductase NimA-like FMN-containing flavoprotein (pyridoxamine 5'-phosphate oxidase superfamily)
MSDDPDVTAVPEHTCWMLLRSVEVARLAVSVDARPDIFPINFVVDHGTVVFRTGEGSKLAAITANPVVAFEADGYDAQAQEAWSVVIQGHAEEIKQLHERIESMDLPLFPWQPAPKSRFVRIVPEHISGRRFHVVDSSAWDAPTRGARRSAAE